MKNKWFRKKEKELEMRLRCANFICMRMTTYDYTKGLSMVLDSIKGEYYFDPRAYHRALAYHRRTVVVPEAREMRTNTSTVDVCFMVRTLHEVIKHE